LSEKDQQPDRENPDRMPEPLLEEIGKMLGRFLAKESMTIKEPGPHIESDE
jgi:hypothetical protein